MSLEDRRRYQRYEEEVGISTERLAHPLNIERLQDELRRVKKDVSYQRLAEMIPRTVGEFAPGYPTGGDLSSQNLYDFLKLKAPSVPSPPRRLAFHAFLMVVDETYREKWNHNYFVKRAGLTLIQFLATDRKTDPYAHALNLQAAAGLYAYRLTDMTRSSVPKAIEQRYLLLTLARDLPFLLAYDFDVLGPGDSEALQGAGFSSEQLTWLRDSWDLDARVGFYIPKRSAHEGILLLNSFKWDWPTVYGAILDYQRDRQIDYFAPKITDILLTDVNSFINIDRSERTYLPSDQELPDERKLFAIRQNQKPESLSQLAALFERKFDWGADL